MKKFNINDLVHKMFSLIYYKVIYKIFFIFPVDEKKVFFEAYYGRQYSCNPKYIYKELKQRNLGYKYVWSLNNINLNKELDECIIVKRKSIKFLYHMATSKYWVVNCQMPANLKPRKETKYLQTWHAAGVFKKFGLDIVENLEEDKKNWMKDSKNWNSLICSTPEITDIYSNAFNIRKGIIYPTGLPRNDLLFMFKNDKTKIEKIKEKLNIKKDKKVILYAPTFREHNGSFDFKLDINKLKVNFGEEYVILLRLHSNISKSIEKMFDNEKKEGFLLDLSKYDDVQELLLISDILITDYSSIVFDFAILERPIIFYSYDLTYYEMELRGFYYDYKSFVPGPIVYFDDDIVSLLKDYNKLCSDYDSKILEFAKRFNRPFDAKASARVVNMLINESSN